MKLRALILAASLAGPAGAPGADDIAAARPGDGGDSDPTTFSFHADSREEPIRGPGGEPLRAEDVPRDYGQYYTVLADGIDVCSLEYAWALGRGGDHPVLQPRYQDLTRWEEAFVENGWLAIDPLIGRFKFAPENRVEDPLRLEHRKKIVLGNLTAWQLEARGKFAFTSQEEETHAVQAFDATDPADFRYAGFSSAPGYSMSLALGETHAYVGGSGYLSIHDIRDPRRIRYVKTLWNGGSEKPFDMAVDLARKRLYQNGVRGLLAYDISKEDDPVLLDLHEDVRLPYIQFQRGCIFGLEAGQGNDSLFTILRIWKVGPDDRIERAGELRLAGQMKSQSGAIRHLLVHEGLAFVILTTGLHVVDVSDPARPLRRHQVHDLSPVPEHYEKGSGAHDLAARGSLLYVACGRSQGGWVNPRESGLFRDHQDFEWKVQGPGEARDIRQRYRGGLRIYDISNPGQPVLAGELDDEVLGCDAITNVALGDGVLFLGSRLIGVIACDLSDPRKPRYLGKLSAMGEVDWARLAGDRLYAVSNGLYVIDPYPAEEARIESFCFTNGFLFGRAVTMNPFPSENPGKLLFTATNIAHRQISVQDPRRPRIVRYDCPPVGYGRWIGNYLFSPGERELNIWRIDRQGWVQKVHRFPVEGLSTHLEVHRDRLFLFGLSWQEDKPVNYLHVFDIGNPERPRLTARLQGLTDAGAMFSPEVYYYRGFCFLPGWMSGRHVGGKKGFGNFQGIRVIDVREPDSPKVHCLIHHIPADVSVDSLCAAESFHASGDTLYVADYWTGIHAIDISGLAERKSWIHLGTVKDRDLPWSVSSYATSASGYGRHLYTTHFGHVNIWEIPAPSDLPAGKLSVRTAEGVARR